MKDRSLEKIWTKSFISIALTQFLVFIAFYTLLTTLPIYVINHLGGSEADGGLVVTVMLIAAIIIRPFSAKLLDLIGKKKGLVLSVTLFTMTTFFYSWIDQLIPLFVLRFIHGISFGILTTVTGAIAADVVPRSRRGAGLGYFAMAMNLALVVGPFIGLTLLQTVSFQTLFIVLSTLLVAGVVSSLFVQIPASTEYQTKKTSFRLKASDLIEIKALPIALISGLVGMAYASIMSFISVYAESLKLSTAASYFFLVFAIVMVASRPSLGRAFDERGPKFVLLPSLLIFSIGLVTLSFTTTAIMLLIAAGFIGLGYGTMLPGLQTMAIQSTDHSRSGHATATFFIFYDLGIGTGSFVWGLVVAIFNFQNMYLINAALALITAFIFNQYLAWKKSSRAKKQQLYHEIQDSKSKI